MPSLGKFIKAKRTAKKMSLRDFGNLAGLSHSYVDSLEKGVDPRSGKSVMPTIDTLVKLSRALNMPLDELLVAAGYLDHVSVEGPYFDPQPEELVSVFLRQLENSDVKLDDKEKIELKKFAKAFVEKYETDSTKAFDRALTSDPELVEFWQPPLCEVRPAL